MQRALCNATAEQEGSDHMHICNLDFGHIGKTADGKVHMCRCGVLFVSVKKSEIDRAGETLEKTQ